MNDRINFGFLGVGRYLPSVEVTNAHLEKLVDTTDDWITQRTGIKTRHIMKPTETLVSMAITAAENAIRNANIQPHQIKYIRVGVNTHLRFPSLAAMVQRGLGIDSTSAADVSAGCSGFIFAVDDIYNHLMVDSLLTKEIGYGLAIGADALSLVIDWTDRSTCVLFGDGAGAVVIGPVESGGILSTFTRTQGEYCDLLTLDDFLDNPMTESSELVLKKRNGTPYPVLRMEGRKVFAVAVKSMMSDIRSVIDKYNRMNGKKLELSDIQYVIPHQANLRIVSAVREGLKLHPEQVHQAGVINHGNTSAATIPIAYVEEWGKRPNTLEVDVAFGAGFASGAILWQTPK